ncbi:MAG: hypothetical protein GY765_30820 [bacterium]|nr:hypothetical protein [bacterium]
MITKILKHKHVLIACLLTLLFIGTAFNGVRNGTRLAPVSLVFQVEMKQPREFRLHGRKLRKKGLQAEQFPDDSSGEAVHAKAGEETSSHEAGAPSHGAGLQNMKRIKVRFRLPDRDLRKIKMRLRVEPGKGRVRVKRVILENLFESRQWEGEEILQLFKNAAGCVKLYAHNDKVYIESGDANQMLVPAPGLFDALAILKENKTELYLFALCLSLVFFFVVANFDVRGLKVFLESVSMRNMGFLLILFLLLLPALNDFLSFIPQSRTKEHRRKAEKPQLRLDNISGYASLYSRYYSDYFSFRGYCIYLNNLLKSKWLGVSPVDGVVVGKDGWLFINKEGPIVSGIDSYRSLTPFKTAELEQWRKVLEERQQWLVARGIKYIFMVAPGKNSIYPEYMPGNIRKVNTRSRLDQLKEYLEKHSTVQLLDPRPALLEAKKKYPVYSVTDSHWNAYGGFIAYGELMKVVSKMLPGDGGLTMSRFEVEVADQAGGDLAGMLGLQQDVFRENMIQLKAEPLLAAGGGKMKNVNRFGSFKRGFTECKNASYPNVLMVHDSFYKKIQPYISESFSRAVYIWDWDMNFFTNVIEEEKPALVIDEMGERFLMKPPPNNKALGEPQMMEAMSIVKN